MPSVAWVALRSNITDATLLPYEVENREDDIPRHDFGIIEKVRHVSGEAHFTFEASTIIQVSLGIAE
jgi:hypothetical protein